MFLILAVVQWTWPSSGDAQLDPERRTYLQAGAEHPFRGNGPLDGYLFLLVNRPQLPWEDWSSRVVLSPTYLRSEVIRDRWPAEGHAFGLGLDGGFFQNDFTEYRNGGYRRRESFWGGGGGARISYYWRPLKIADLIPVEGMLRFRPEYAVYARGTDTSSAFRLPADSAIYSARAGIRVGGVPPDTIPEMAMEVSFYHQISYRDSARPFGFTHALQRTRHFTQRSWARAGGIFPIWLDHNIGFFATGGIAQQTDALSVFRLGGPFRFLNGELPLLLHGYNPEEVFARRFGLFNLSYELAPVPQLDWVRLQLIGDYAHVRFLTGRSLPRRDLFATGANLITRFGQNTVVLGYGHGFDAPRGDRIGGHHIHLILERKFDL